MRISPVFLVRLLEEGQLYINKSQKEEALTCFIFQAEGKPDPEIIWFKHDAPVTQSSSVKIMNEGTELRINRIMHSDLSDYTCVARNGEGRIHHTARVVIAGRQIRQIVPRI